MREEDTEIVSVCVCLAAPSSDEYRHRSAAALYLPLCRAGCNTLHALSSLARIPTCELSCSCSSALASFSSSSFKSFAPRRVCRAGSVMGRAGRYHRQDTIKRGDERASRANTGILAVGQNERVSTVFDGWPSRRNCVEVTKWRGTTSHLGDLARKQWRAKTRFDCELF